MLTTTNQDKVRKFACKAAEEDLTASNGQFFKGSVIDVVEVSFGTLNIEHKATPIRFDKNFDVEDINVKRLTVDDYRREYFENRKLQPGDKFKPMWIDTCVLRDAEGNVYKSKQTCNWHIGKGNVFDTVQIVSLMEEKSKHFTILPFILDRIFELCLANKATARYPAPDMNPVTFSLHKKAVKYRNEKLNLLKDNIIKKFEEVTGRKVTFLTGKNISRFHGYDDSKTIIHGYPKEDYRDDYAARRFNPKLFDMSRTLRKGWRGTYNLGAGLYFLLNFNKFNGSLKSVNLLNVKGDYYKDSEMWKWGHEVPQDKEDYEENQYKPLLAREGIIIKHSNKMEAFLKEAIKAGLVCFDYEVLLIETPNTFNMYRDFRESQDFYKMLADREANP